MSNEKTRYDLTADDIAKNYEALAFELKQLEELNKSLDRTTESLAAYAHGANLLKLVHAVREETALYEYFVSRLNKNAGK